MNKYGKPSAVSNAQVQNIVSLSHINNANPKKSSQVLEKITMQCALDTLRKITEMNGYVTVTLDKFEGIQADLVRNDNNQLEWKYQQLVDTIEMWTARNPIPLRDKRISEKGNSYSNSYQAKQNNGECVKPHHRSSYTNLTIKLLLDVEKC